MHKNVGLSVVHRQKIDKDSQSAQRKKAWTENQIKLCFFAQVALSLHPKIMKTK
jgi:hypothetical protein